MSEMDQQQQGSYVMANGNSSQPNMPPSYPNSQAGGLRGAMPPNYRPQHFGQPNPRQPNPVMVNGNPGQRQMRPHGPQSQMHPSHQQMMQNQPMMRVGLFWDCSFEVGFITLKSSLK